MWNNIPYYYLFDNFQVRFLSNNIFGFYYESMSSMLSAAIQNLDRMHVGLTERFDDSIKYFSAVFLFQNDSFENKNISGRDKSGDDGLISLVQQHNFYDDILYRYAKLKFDEQLRKV